MGYAQQRAGGRPDHSACPGRGHGPPEVSDCRIRRDRIDQAIVSLRDRQRPRCCPATTSATAPPDIPTDPAGRHGGCPRPRSARPTACGPPSTSPSPSSPTATPALSATSRTPKVLVGGGGLPASPARPEGLRADDVRRPGAVADPLRQHQDAGPEHLEPLRQDNKVEVAPGRSHPGTPRQYGRGRGGGPPRAGSGRATRPYDSNKDGGDQPGPHQRHARPPSARTTTGAIGERARAY